MLRKTSLNHPNGRDGLVAVRSPRSAAAEAYRTLRTNLQFSSLDRDVLVWDLDGGDFQKLDGHPDTLTSYAFAPTEGAVVVGDGDARLRVWKLEPADTQVLRGHTSPSLAFVLVGTGVGSFLMDGSRTLIGLVLLGGLLLALWSLTGPEQS